MATNSILAELDMEDDNPLLTDPVNVISGEMIGTEEVAAVQPGGDLDTLLLPPPADEISEEQALEMNFYDNLAPQIDDRELNEAAMRLLEMLKQDEEARKEYMEIYKKAIECMGKDGGVLDGKVGDSTESQRRLATVKQTLLQEGVVHFNANTMNEALPPSGPVKIKIVGDGSEELIAQGDIVKDFTNFQINHNIDGYFDTLDTMFTHLALTGSAFQFISWHPVKEKVDVEFVTAEDLVISPDSKSLGSSPRFTHKVMLPINEFRKLVDVGYYEDAPHADEMADDDSESESMKVAGIQLTDNSVDEESQIITLYNIYTYWRWDSVDSELVNPEIDIPYIITIEPTSQKVIAVRRNWDGYDPKYEPLKHFVSYKFLPGMTQIYGRGLYEGIGGLDKAATACVRSLLDAAAYENSVTGYKRTGAEGGQKTLMPGDMQEVRGGTNAINSDIMPIKFNGPSQTMFQLYGMITEEGRRFAMISDLNVGELSQRSNLPVGTITALIEQGHKQFSAIHKRMHKSQGEAFKIMMRLYRDNMPEQVEFTAEGKTQVILREYFDDRIDIIPVSDPNISSNTQRIVMTQELLQIAEMNPTLIDKGKVLERMLEAMNVPNWEELVMTDDVPPQFDPVTENSRSLSGVPIKAYPGQHHEAHIAVHVQFMQDPSLGASPFGQQALVLLEAHVREHVAMLYKERAFQTLNQPIEIGEDGIDPQLDYQLSEQFSVMAQEMNMHPIPAIESMNDDPSVNLTLQLAQVEMQIKQDQHNQELQHKAEKLRADLENQRIREETNASNSQANNAMKLKQIEDIHQQNLLNKDEEFEQRLEEQNVEMLKKISDKEDELQQKLKEKDAELAQKIKAANEAHAQKMQAEHDAQVKKLEDERAKLEQDKLKLEADINNLQNDMKALQEEIRRKKEKEVKPPQNKERTQ